MNDANNSTAAGTDFLSVLMGMWEAGPAAEEASAAPVAPAAAPAAPAAPVVEHFDAKGAAISVRVTFPDGRVYERAVTRSRRTVRWEQNGSRRVRCAELVAELEALAAGGAA